ncbi:outer dense fiber protein 3-like protein 1 [Ornithorhynchus anatinus]|uniref:Outer dense fiber of sperm tails 3 like 1 n=1 Tax=Ornithorhynchus anatinus TaxID=9258 RepID=F7AQK1_ORNAN|nr:outer dense fiber protein 3-like protein 1 [Ornithorhynchus anatinus]
MAEGKKGKAPFDGSGSRPTWLPRLLRQETKCTPVIMTKLKGPGSGKYSRQPCTGYIDHDITMFREPAYTFRIMHSGKRYSDPCSPGPCYYFNPNLTRFGMSHSPQVSIFERLPNLRTESTPEPATYHWEKVPPPGERCAPAFSMGSRWPFRVSDPTPGPGQYSLPRPPPGRGPGPTLGSTCTLWAFNKDLVRGPGPAAYSRPDPDTFLTRSPCHSLALRLQPPKGSSLGPGPGAYNVHRVTIHKPRAPACTLHIRHSDYLTPLVIDVKD